VATSEVGETNLTACTTTPDPEKLTLAAGVNQLPLKPTFNVVP
jgi:hypothetical protein